MYHTNVLKEQEAIRGVKRKENASLVKAQFAIKHFTDDQIKKVMQQVGASGVTESTSEGLTLPQLGPKVPRAAERAKYNTLDPKQKGDGRSRSTMVTRAKGSSLSPKSKGNSKKE